MPIGDDWKPEDLTTLDQLATHLGGQGIDLLKVMYAESGASAKALNDNPKARLNKNTGLQEPVPLDERYNAAGVIQCMPFILKNLGFSTGLGPRARAEAYCSLTVGQQLPFVARYFAPHAGKLVNATAWYLATFEPVYIGRAGEPDFILADAGDKGFSGAVFRANSGFDRDHDRKIQVRELAQAIEANCVGARWENLSTRLLTGAPPAAQPNTLPPAVHAFDLGTWWGLQGALTALGYGPGTIDGVWGPQTSNALHAFQAAHPPLLADGVMGPLTRAVLQHALFDAAP